MGVYIDSIWVTLEIVSCLLSRRIHDTRSTERVLYHIVSGPRAAESLIPNCIVSIQYRMDGIGKLF